MVQTLEAIKGGGGSIRVGTIGTISALMTRELESIKVDPPTPTASSRNKHHTASVSVTCGASNQPKKLQARKSTDEASSSSSGNSNHIYQKTEIPQKLKSHLKTTSQIPMLSDDIDMDKTPIRPKVNKKGPTIVEVVDIKCGSPGRAWAGPVTTRLKKLGFSKMSENVV